MIAGEIQSFCENFEETLVWNFQISGCVLNFHTHEVL